MLILLLRDGESGIGRKIRPERKQTLEELAEEA